MTEWMIVCFSIVIGVVFDVCRLGLYSEDYIHTPHWKTVLLVLPILSLSPHPNVYWRPTKTVAWYLCSLVIIAQFGNMWSLSRRHELSSQVSGSLCFRTVLESRLWSPPLLLCVHLLACLYDHCSVFGHGVVMSRPQKLLAYSSSVPASRLASRSC